MAAAESRPGDWLRPVKARAGITTPPSPSPGPGSAQSPQRAPPSEDIDVDIHVDVCRVQYSYRLCAMRYKLQHHHHCVHQPHKGVRYPTQAPNSWWPWLGSVDSKRQRHCKNTTASSLSLFLPERSNACYRSGLHPGSTFQNTGNDLHHCAKFQSSRLIAQMARPIP